MFIHQDVERELLKIAAEQLVAAAAQCEGLSTSDGGGASLAPGVLMMILSTYPADRHRVCM